MRADKGVELLEKGKKPRKWSQRKWKQFGKDTQIVMENLSIDGKQESKPFYIQYTVRGAGET